MSLREPEHATERDMADWLYEHRGLSSAEMLLDGAAGRLVRRDSASGTYVSVEPWDVPQEELDEARSVLIESGIWTENQGPAVAPGTKIPEVLLRLQQRQPSVASSSTESPQFKKAS